MKNYKEMERFHYYCAEFIDRFNYASVDEKIKLTETFPFKDKYVTGNKIRSAYMAAVVEELCRRDKIRVPGWVNDDHYFLKRPFFAGDLESIKAFLIVESPLSFRRRNIFVSENAVVRV